MFVAGISSVKNSMAILPSPVAMANPYRRYAGRQLASVSAQRILRDQAALRSGGDNGVAVVDRHRDGHICCLPPGMRVRIGRFVMLG
jgi:hypothetical protein